jgi:hypothetical protein
VVEYGAELPALAIELDDGTVEFVPEIPPANRPSPNRKLASRSPTAMGPAPTTCCRRWDYAPSGEELPIEAAVRMSLAPGVPVLAGGAVFTGAAGQGCWSLEEPIAFRVTQVARELATTVPGPTAFIHQRADAIEIDTATWTALVSMPTYPAYCDDF